MFFIQFLTYYYNKNIISLDQNCVIKKNRRNIPIVNEMYIINKQIEKIHSFLTINVIVN